MALCRLAENTQQPAAGQQLLAQSLALLGIILLRCISLAIACMAAKSFGGIQIVAQGGEHGRWKICLARILESRRGVLNIRLEQRAIEAIQTGAGLSKQIFRPGELRAVLAR